MILPRGDGYIMPISSSYILASEFWTQVVLGIAWIVQIVFMVFSDNLNETGRIFGKRKFFIFREGGILLFAVVMGALLFIAGANMGLVPMRLVVLGLCCIPILQMGHSRFSFHPYSMYSICNSFLFLALFLTKAGYWLKANEYL